MLRLSEGGLHSAHAVTQDDDQVDALAWMATMAVNKEPPRRPKTKEPESWRKKLSVLGGAAGHMSA